MFFQYFLEFLYFFVYGNYLILNGNRFSSRKETKKSARLVLTDKLVVVMEKNVH